MAHFLFLCRWLCNYIKMLYSGIHQNKFAIALCIDICEKSEKIQLQTNIMIGKLIEH
jgi:hypothetical protein